MGAEGRRGTMVKHECIYRVYGVYRVRAGRAAWEAFQCCCQTQSPPAGPQSKRPAPLAGYSLAIRLIIPSSVPAIIFAFSLLMIYSALYSKFTVRNSYSNTKLCALFRLNSARAS